MISQFKSAKADFFTNVPLPPDFATMWKQSLQQGFKPKLATVAKVLLFPTDAYAMGSEAYNIATDSWWVPSLPWTSSFTGQTCQQLADLYTSDGNGQPNANISNYSLFEIAYQAFMSVNDPHNKTEVAGGPVQGQPPPGGGRAAQLHVDQREDEPGSRCRDHPAGRHPVAEGHDLRARGQGRRQHPAAAEAKITGDLLPTFK